MQCPMKALSISMSTSSPIPVQRPAQPKRTFAMIGHVSKDVNIIRGETTTAAGGGTFFGCIAAANLGMEVQVITKCASEDMPLFKNLFEEANVRVTFLPSAKSTSCENNYPTASPEDRKQRMLSLGAPFTEDDLRHITSEVLVINALWYGEFPPEFIPKVKLSCPSVKYLVADAQGFVRHVIKQSTTLNTNNNSNNTNLHTNSTTDTTTGGRMVHTDWVEKEKYLKYLDLLKIDSSEGRILTGHKDVKEAMRILYEKGAKMVLATSTEGVYLYDGSQFFQANFGPWSQSTPYSTI
jgi:sugar/nucleoside kinase (ribokinase family)